MKIHKINDAASRSLQAENQKLQNQLAAFRNGTAMACADSAIDAAKQWEKEVESLHARVAELEKDAARYQWLREGMVSDDARQDEMLNSIVNATPSYEYCQEHLSEARQIVDAAIDAAMSKEKEK